MKRANSWSTRDERWLQRHYRTASRAELLRRLGRTWLAVKTRADRLGLRRSDRQFWTPEENEALRRPLADLALAVAFAAIDALAPHRNPLVAALAWLELRFPHPARGPPWAPQAFVGWNIALLEAGSRSHLVATSQTASIRAREVCRRLSESFELGMLVNLPDGAVKDRAEVHGPRVGVEAPQYTGPVWRAVHILLWEEVHGPVPPGHAVAFRDGRCSNVQLSNLELIPRSELMRRNSIHRYPELAALSRTIGVLNRRIHEKEKSNAQKHIERPA